MICFRSHSKKVAWSKAHILYSTLHSPVGTHRVFHRAGQWGLGPPPPAPLLLTPSLAWREKGLVAGGRDGGRAPAAVGPSEVVCVLSPSYGDQVQHFKVLREASGKYYLWEEKFNSLNELVAFYRTRTIAKKRQVFLRDEEPLAKVGECGGRARGPLRRAPTPLPTWQEVGPALLLKFRTGTAGRQAGLGKGRRGRQGRGRWKLPG